MPIINVPVGIKVCCVTHKDRLLNAYVEDGGSVTIFVETCPECIDDICHGGRTVEEDKRYFNVTK